MSASQLSAVLVNALTDECFCQSLLDTPAQALTRFDLSADEVQALSSIRANTIEEFAAGMVSWLSHSQPVRRPLVAAPAFVPV